MAAPIEAAPIEVASSTLPSSPEFELSFLMVALITVIGAIMLGTFVAFYRTVAGRRPPVADQTSNNLHKHAGTSVLVDRMSKHDHDHDDVDVFKLMVDLDVYAKPSPLLTSKNNVYHSKLIASSCMDDVKQP